MKAPVDILFLKQTEAQSTNYQNASNDFFYVKKNNSIPLSTLDEFKCKSFCINKVVADKRIIKWYFFNSRKELREMINKLAKEQKS